MEKMENNKISNVLFRLRKNPMLLEKFEGNIREFRKFDKILNFCLARYASLRKIKTV